MKPPAMRMFRYSRLQVIALLLIVPMASAQQEVRFGVLGLFHPRELFLEQGSTQVLFVAAKNSSNLRALALNGEPDHRQLVFRAEGDRVIAAGCTASSWTVTARDGGAADFWLIAPGKIHRAYWGRLNVSARSGELIAVTIMDRETAVASIVAAEMDQSAPMEALKAQAIATRSFLAAGSRHLDFDFCDTTHCQFLRSPPLSTSRVAKAVEATLGLVIVYGDKPLGAMYSSRCGGRTRSLRDVGEEPGEGYPYYAVQCVWCQHHPLLWHSRINGDGPPQPGDERQRIVHARQSGWSAIPSNDFSIAKEGSNWRLEGHGIGHGVGMCQFGASGMAAAGKNFREILSHYYPNTTLTSLP